MVHAPVEGETFEAYLGDLPRLHTWDLGKTWNTGGFNSRKLKRMHTIVSRHFDGRKIRVIETGAGNSTITFLQLPLVEQVVSIAPDAGLRDRIAAYCSEHGINVAPLDFRVERSEVELPTIALASANGATAPGFDVTLIDGGHGWPTVFVDFCYTNVMMRAGALLFLDDLQIYSVTELSRLLAMQPGFTLREEIGKLQVWEKEDNRPFLPEHSREPYILDMMARERLVSENGDAARHESSPVSTYLPAGAGA